MQLSVVIPALREAENLARLLPLLHQVLSRLDGADPPVSAAESGEVGVEYELIVVDNHSGDGTAEVCEGNHAVLVHQRAPGYGGALWAGFAKASGEYILTMDADLSHIPSFIPTMWEKRAEAEVVIASRYVEGGSAEMPLYRHVLSIVLNVVYTRLLDLPVKDISSGFRLYRASVVQGLDLISTDFDALEEILIKCYAGGSRICEVPFRYVPRSEGRSKVRLLQFGVSYLRTLLRMWKLRNSIAAADYDARAYDSPIPLQRYWQRRRYDIIMNMTGDAETSLDIGCGSSRILGGLDRCTIGLDVSLGKLRYARCYGRPLVNGSAFALPFSDGSFEQVVCSQVVEHLPSGDEPFAEFVRVLRDGGRLILGTPDYGRWNWKVIERLYRLCAPDAYGDKHITHYSRRSVLETLERHGFHLDKQRYIMGAEMILALTKSDDKV